MRKKIIVILLILALSIYTLNINVQSAVKENDNRPTSLELTPHDPIEITSDSDFEVFPGTGTEVDPYLIEGYNITTTSQKGIYIAFTTKYFVIRNCYVEAAEYGIHIYDVADVITTVINNTCNNNWYGIKLYYSGSSTVANNTCSDNGSSIRLSYSSNSTVVNNICNNNDIGIVLYYSYYSTVANNTCSKNNNYGGIYLSSSGSSTVANNTCINNYIGIKLYYSNSSTVTNNTCNNNNNYEGISIWSSSNSTVANNTCNDNREGIRLDFSGSSTVANNTCSNNNFSIAFWYSSNSTATNNTCTNNNNYGIYLHSSDFCVFTYNLLQENEEYGVYSSSGSDNNIIHHNTFVDNNLGGTSQAFDDCTNNTWYNNATQKGNFWSDWSGTGSYSIDGSANSVDLYPLNEPAEHSVESTTEENPLNFIFTLLMLVVTLIFTRIISKKAKN
ncbi:hypothetical protein ES705_20089 [subsurface metagenome]